MKAKNSNILIINYAACPKCGSELIGSGEGTLLIENDIFERTCKCGFHVVIKESNEGCISELENSSSNNEVQVIIGPTLATAWGVDNKFDLYNIDYQMIHQSIPYGDLKNIITENHYVVVGGSKYL